MREQIHNRHVRFGGEQGGLWTEPIQPLTGRVPLIHERRNVYPDQLAGRRVPDREAYDARGQQLLDDWAVWSDFKLVQPTADGFEIRKRTGPDGAWIASNAGSRASGLVFVGAQWSLNAIELLEMIGDRMPTEHPAWEAN